MEMMIEQKGEWRPPIEELFLPEVEEEIREYFYNRAKMLSDKKDIPSLEEARALFLLLRECEGRGALLKKCAEKIKKLHKQNALFQPKALKEALKKYREGIYNEYIDYYGISIFAIPDDVKIVVSYAFKKCKIITSLIIPEGVTSIESSAFLDSANLVRITIASSVTDLAMSAFSGCSSLKSIYISERNPVYQSIDGNILSRDGKTFYQYAEGKTQTEFILPDGVMHIEKFAFMDSNHLTNITIPNSVKSIGMDAFSRCRHLSSIAIPNSVIHIERGIFSCCEQLSSVKLPDHITAIPESTFFMCSFSQIDIPEGVTSVGKYAFSECKNLTSITLPYHISIIGSYAFQACENLTSITLPYHISIIGSYTFQACENLTSITIPDSVTKIGAGAFGCCTNLQYIKFRGSRMQWERIEKGYLWDKETGNYTIIFDYRGV